MRSAIVMLVAMLVTVCMPLGQSPFGLSGAAFAQDGGDDGGGDDGPGGGPGPGPGGPGPGADPGGGGAGPGPAGAGGDGPGDRFTPFWDPFRQVGVQRPGCECYGWSQISCTCPRERRPVRISRPRPKSTPARASVAKAAPVPKAVAPRSAPARRDTPAPSRTRVEVVVLGLTPGDLDALQQQGFLDRGQRTSALLAGPVARLASPPGVGLAAALARIRGLAPGATAVRNDLYPRSTYFRTAGRPCGTACEQFKLTAWQPSPGACRADIRVGIVETAVDRSHPSLAQSRIETRRVRRDDKAGADADHGTGVASLLVGAAESGVAGLASGVTLLAADAFHRISNADPAVSDAYDLIASLDWLVEERANVVNMSLTGPDNALLKVAVGRTLERQILIIAAAGLPDASGQRGYPARYEGVLAVAAVDNRLRSSRLSARGAHIAYAAPGVGLVVAGTGGKIQQVDGTSFAAPFVTAAIARGLNAAEKPASIVAALTTSARDLGAPGRDDIYGWGLMQFTAVPACR